MKHIKIAVMAALLIVSLSGCSQREVPNENKVTGPIEVGAAMGSVTADLFSASEESNAETMPEKVQAESPKTDENQTPAEQTVPSAVNEQQTDEQSVTQTETVELAPVAQPEAPQPAVAPEPVPAAQPEAPQPAVTPEPVPEPQAPARPAFDAGTVISLACSQIGGMTRVNGAEQGMGSFTHSFSVSQTQESIAADLAAIMAQERDLYGNTYYDIVYCGESGGYHTFRCYRA